MKKKLEIGLVAVLCLLLWVTEMMTGWFSAHFPSWFFQTVWGVTLVVYVIIPAGQIWLFSQPRLAQSRPSNPLSRL